MVVGALFARWQNFSSYSKLTVYVHFLLHTAGEKKSVEPAVGNWQSKRKIYGIAICLSKESLVKGSLFELSVRYVRVEIS